MRFVNWVSYLAVATAVLCAAIAAGVKLAVPEHTSARTDTPPVAAKMFLDRVEPKGQRVRLCFAIFMRNLMVYALLLSGLASAGITSISLLAFNGLALGELFGGAHASGVPLSLLMATTLPHAIPEFSAFLLAAAIGFRGPALFAAWLRGALSLDDVSKLWPVISAGACIIAAAAFVEAYWTIPIARFLVI